MEGAALQAPDEDGHSFSKSQCNFKLSLALSLSLCVGGGAGDGHRGFCSQSDPITLLNGMLIQ